MTALALLAACVAANIEVRLPDGGPAAGLPVVPIGIKASATTDVDGRAELPDGVTYFIVTQVGTEHTFKTSDGATVVRLPSLEDVGGIVIGTDGLPVQGATVEVTSSGDGVVRTTARGLTDPGGVWSARIVAGSTPSLTATHPDRVTAQESGVRVPRESLLAGKHSLAMRRGGTITAAVTSPDGRPVPGVMLRFHGWRDEFGVTNEDGLATLGDGETPVRFPPGTFNLTAFKPGFAPTKFRVPVREGIDSSSEVRLSAGKPTSLIVVDSEARPIAGANVRFPSEVARGEDARAGQTDVGGVWSWDHCPDSIFLGVSADGYVTRWIKAHPSEEPIEVPLKSLVSARVLVVDAVTGERIDSADVVVDTNSGDENYNWRVTPAERDGDVLTLDEAYRAKRVRFFVTAPGYATTWTPPVSADDCPRTVRIEMRPAGPRTVAVLTADGEPAAGAEVAAARNGLSVNTRAGNLRLGNSVRTDDAGVCQLAAWDADHHIAARSDAGFAIASSRELADEPVLTLTPWSSVRGVAMLGDRPAGGARVSLRLQDMPRSGEVPFRFDHSVQTDADGRFEIARFPAGAIGLELSHSDDSGRSINGPFVTLDAPAGGVEGVTLPPAGATVAGRLAGVEDPTAVRIEIELDRTAARKGGVIRVFRLRSDAEGRFECPGLPVGRHRFTAKRSLNGPAEAKVVTVRSTDDSIDLGDIEAP